MFYVTQDSLVLSMGYRTIHVLPFLGGRLDPMNARRINLGGFEIISYLCRLLQLKYPSHSSIFSFGKAEVGVLLISLIFVCQYWF